MAGSTESAQLQALCVCIAIRRIRYTAEIEKPYLSSALSTKGNPVLSGAPGLFAEEGKEEACQGWEAGADDAEANLNAGPELRHGTGVWAHFVRQDTETTWRMKAIRCRLTHEIQWIDFEKDNEADNTCYTGAVVGHVSRGA